MRECANIFEFSGTDVILAKFVEASWELVSLGGISICRDYEICQKMS